VCTGEGRGLRRNTPGCRVAKPRMKKRRKKKDQKSANLPREHTCQEKPLLQRDKGELRRGLGGEKLSATARGKGKIPRELTAKSIRKAPFRSRSRGKQGPKKEKAQKKKKTPRRESENLQSRRRSSLNDKE